MRRVCVLLASLLLGCASVGSRAGLPPTDRHNRVVVTALESVVPRAVEAAMRDAAPPGTTPEFRGQGCVGSTGEQEWQIDVRYVGTDGTAVLVEDSHFARVMTAVRDAAWHAVKVDGVEAVGSAGSPSSDALSLKGKHWGEPVAFVLQYFRRDMAVQGEVVGSVGPSPSQPGFTRVKVIATEWCTR
ncbi:hypothetical protein [Urbifossiella limnaea]|uniref:Lipoprotein n=1 Tax=Urbifossiella limnaea TaxID=2528023 RepID=A0A517XRX0_9BACT|nr:hypothetical protein [Urbifossiella limnaea]QDU20254.1 hypothetical protein ETAA1_22000 [Urbifossiella limnaea]